MKTKFITIAALFWITHVAISAVGGSAITNWEGKQYETELKYSDIEAVSKWDGTSTPILVSADVALRKSNQWMEEHFPEGEWELGNLILGNHADGDKKNLWTWIINYQNDNQRVVFTDEKGRDYIEKDELSFFVLMDGTLINPTIRKSEE
jgi:hypothetical protein